MSNEPDRTNIPGCSHIPVNQVSAIGDKAYRKNYSRIDWSKKAPKSTMEALKESTDVSNS